MSPDEFEQIKRAHQSARPKPHENPAWWHTHRDLARLIAAYEDQAETICKLLDSIDIRNKALDDWENGRKDA